MEPVEMARQQTVTVKATQAGHPRRLMAALRYQRLEVEVPLKATMEKVEGAEAAVVELPKLEPRQITQKSEAMAATQIYKAPRKGTH